MTDASDFLPARESLKAPREAAAGCRGCELAPVVVATIHPSAILREPDDGARHPQREAFTSDLLVAAQALRAR